MLVVLTACDALSIALPCIHTLASHLGMLDEPREGCEVGTEHEDSVWWTYPEDGRTPGVHV